MAGAMPATNTKAVAATATTLNTGPTTTPISDPANLPLFPDPPSSVASSSVCFRPHTSQSFAA